ncbi:porin [Methylotenera oryzisoli]|uniref:Porin n=1 Tax=Methylotenera oryzisoli TaxID=2080758 RepID=A0A4Y9VNS3_9PROT|nr:porin [Methylotenera oryzisoli]TFW70127.1 porin [Methylotenera oryzisoli]
MKTTIKLAVASALVAAASSAQAGITIPAGDWTLDIGGVVNAYYTTTKYSGDNGGTAALGLGNGDAASSNNITTGLLPNYLSVSGKTRQNDLDVGFTISLNPGASTAAAGNQAAQQENRQAFLTFGDKSWGSIKLGKDLGIYASDAILNDMTLLGVGGGAGSLAGNTTTLGRIGSGFMYADWKSQVAYSSPNWNGFSFTVGLTQGWNATSSNSTTNNVTTSPFVSLSGTSDGRSGASSAYEGKASYEWAGDVAGKVWASGIYQKVSGLSAGGADRAQAFDIGTTVNVAGFGLTGYYGKGDGIGQTFQLRDGFDAQGRSRDSDQWYVQGTYTLPGVGTKLGVSYGESTLDGNSGEQFKEVQDSMWTVGAYHPITKHLNLVAEYSESERDLDKRAAADVTAKAKTVSLGAILFF